MSLSVEQLFEHLWQQYIQINPQAEKIQQLLEQRGETIINDHIALRTFNTKKLGLVNIADSFIRRGYKVIDEYDFSKKKLNAIHLEHVDNINHPKVFISELRTELFSENLQNIIAQIDAQITEEEVAQELFITSGRTWNLSFEQYIQLLRESEYAAWTAAFGYRANHFTVSLNHLTTFFNLEDLNNFLLQHGFVLNDTAGSIKGTPQQYLEQSSTMAAPVNLEFDHSTHVIPGCFYEFAKRYPLPETGRLYQGFITASADKIFESTNN
ncbi:MAG: DUF1338 domain-containing protein [Alcanivoracaceae bacterium]|nr:DUF1338 domain-containing protein [Alcanivoracaceae bacterium]